MRKEGGLASFEWQQRGAGGAPPLGRGLPLRPRRLRVPVERLRRSRSLLRLAPSVVEGLAHSSLALSHSAWCQALWSSAPAFDAGAVSFYAKLATESRWRLGFDKTSHGRNLVARTVSGSPGANFASEYNLV